MMATPESIAAPIENRFGDYNPLMDLLNQLKFLLNILLRLTLINGLGFPFEIFNILPLVPAAKKSIFIIK